MGNLKAPKTFRQWLQSTSATVIHHTKYHANTLLLFTKDQLFDIVIPGTAFGILAAKSGPVLDLPLQPTSTLLKRAALVSLWLWLLVLQATLKNQLGTASIQEDAINKPWRPLPSKRITPAQAQHLLTFTYLVNGGVSYWLDVMPMFMGFTVLLVAYNDYGGSDHSSILRNLVNGAGIACLFSGALDITLGIGYTISHQAWAWCLLLNMGVMVTTIQIQDVRDEIGDRVRGRQTIVTLLGRTHALWTVAVIVCFWSLYLPLFYFRCGWKATALPVAMGAYLVATIVRAMRGQNQELDRQMYRLWSAWMLALCPLPLLQAMMG
jgi:4-hydroxybenzoate polyprenyltransferase